jgi:heterodisulfide reductase subunit B
MVGILEALGATVHRHNREASCCGTSLLTTKPEVGFQMVGAILEASSLADCIVTVCPMCHFNLDSYQGKVSQQMGRALHIPVLFLPQLMGLSYRNQGVCSYGRTPNWRLHLSVRYQHRSHGGRGGG